MEAQSFDFPIATLRIFQRAVQCIAKLGKDAAVIFRPDQLVLRGADDGHSSALHFVFGRKMFRSCPALAGGVGETKVVVVARQLLIPLSGSQTKNAEGLTIRLSGQRILLEFSSRFGKVRHGVPLLETLPFLPGDPAAGPHAAAMAPSLLAKVMQHCIPQRSGCEEVTLGAALSEGLRMKSEDLTNTVAEAGSHRTEVLVQMSDLEACSLDPSGGEVRILGRGLRDFAKAAEVFARDLDNLGVLDGSALLELRFGEDSGSVLCSLAIATGGVVRPLEHFKAVFMVAIRESSGALPAPPAQPTPTPAPASSATARRPQPRQGSKRRAVEATTEDFDAFPEPNSQRPVIDLTQTQAQQTQPVSATQDSRMLQLFTQQQKVQMASQHPTPSPMPPVVPPPVVPPSSAPVPNGVNGTGSVNGVNGGTRSQEIPQSWWPGRVPATPASLSRPVLASNIQAHRDVFDSDDELIGADPDEIAFARGDQEEEAPDWFDCEKLW